MTSIEVCIVAFGSEATIDECIESLALLGPGTRIALADNHPDQGTTAVARRAAERSGLEIRLLARPDNPGFAVACNALARTSESDVLFFLNPDAVVTHWPGGVALGPGVTAPAIFGPDGSREHSYGRERTIRDEIARRLQIRPKQPDGSGYVSGAALLIDRTEFLSVGGFDERYFMYYEDIDLCRTVVEHGGSVRIDESIVVEHVGGFSSADVPAATALRSYESARRYHVKWSGTARWFDLLALIDSALRAGAGRIGVPVPGRVGAVATLRAAWSNVRPGGPAR